MLLGRSVSPVISRKLPGASWSFLGPGGSGGFQEASRSFLKGGGYIHKTYSLKVKGPDQEPSRLRVRCSQAG